MGSDKESRGIVRGFWRGGGAHAAPCIPEKSWMEI
jgi:hypothetical protein